MLRCLPFHMYCCVCHAPTSPEIEKCKDEHPHEIDEVPVQAGDLDDLVIALPTREKAAPLDIEISSKNLSCDCEQENHADGHVCAVEAGDHEKACAKLRRAPRIAPGPDAFHDQLGPFE